MVWNGVWKCGDTFETASLAPFPLSDPRSAAVENWFIGRSERLYCLAFCLPWHSPSLAYRGLGRASSEGPQQVNS